MAQTIPPQSFYITKSIPNSNGLSSISLRSRSLPITLRTLLPSDIPTLTSIFSNPENTKDDLSVATMSIVEIKEMIKTWLITTSPLSKMNFIILNSKGEAIGISGFGWIGPHGREDEDAGRAGAAGVVLNPEHRRKGYGYEALRMSVDYGLRELGLVEVRIGTTSRNQGMRDLMERRFGLPATVTEEDRFGNDLEWRFGREWLSQEHK